MASEAVEQVLHRRLSGLRRRLRWLAVGAGAGQMLLAVAGALVATVALDYALNLPAWPRLVLTAAAAVGVVVAAWRLLGRELFRPLRLTEVAGRVEETFAESEDRVRSAVEFIWPTDSKGPMGADGHSSAPAASSRSVAWEAESDLLRRRVCQEAAELVSRIDLRRAVDAGPFRRWLARASACGGVLALLVLAMPSDYRQAAWWRLSDPFGGHAWPKRTHIALLGEVPDRVASGDRVGVRVRLARGDRPSARATVFYQYDDGPVRQELMARGPDGTYTATLDARSAGDDSAVLRVWVRSGDDQRALPPVTVVPRLAVRRVSLDVTPPAYAWQATGEEPVRFDLSRAPATVVEGSSLRLVAEFNKPLGEGFAVHGLEPAPQMSHSARTGEAVWIARQSSRLTLSANDTDGFAMAVAPELEVLVRPDQMPAVELERPRRTEERTAASTVPLEAVAEDDFAVIDVELRVERLGDGRRWAIRLVSEGRAVSDADWQPVVRHPGRSRQRVGYAWALAALSGPAELAALRPGDVLEYHLAVRDNYRLELPDGTVRVHPEATSSRQRIVIISPGELSARLADELRQLAGQIDQLRLGQQRTADETAELRHAAAGPGALDAARQRQARRLAEQQSTLGSQARQLAARADDVLRRMAENRLDRGELETTARDVRDLLDRVSEGPMREAASQLNESREAAAEARDATLRQALERQAQAQTLLQQALERLGSLGTLSQTLQSLQQLLDEQQNVSRATRELARNNTGRRPDELSGQDRQQLADLTQRQRELARRSDELMQQMAQQAGQLERSDPQAAEALRQSAHAGREQNVASAQQRAGNSLSQNQPNNAQADQRQAEVGLQMMLRQLRDAERRRLETLSRQLADLSEQLGVLVRRQAGHNLDNLSLRPDALRQLDQAQLAELLGLAERNDPWVGGAADLAALSAGQELTERNTRALAVSASRIEGSAEAAGLLSRAASRMERAAVLLRGNDLNGAFEPPQVEALAVLRQTSELVERMQRQARQSLEQRQRETLRAVYEAVRAEQESLLRDTTRIARLADATTGEVPRAERIRLGQLAAQQNQLAQRIAGQDELLADLGSTVFVYVNRDLADTMTDAAARLDRRDVTASTRLQQQRALDQLDAMIAALTIAPYEREFEDRSSGSGGGSGEGQPQARLPGETELRLLKGMQQLLNRGTEDAAAREPAQQPDAARPLGQRQSELRKLLGDMIAKASRGRAQLPDPPTRPLPEEAQSPADADADLDTDLLLGRPVDQAESRTPVQRVADRMARVAERLIADADVGPVTRRLQSRILDDLDQLIEQARRQDQQSAQSSGSRSRGQPKPAAQPGGEQAPQQGQGRQQAGRTESAGGDGATAERDEPGQRLSPQGGELLERLSEWGAISPRQRQAIIEGAGDTPVAKYRQLIEAYYRALAEQQSGASSPARPGGRSAP